MIQIKDKQVYKLIINCICRIQTKHFEMSSVIDQPITLNCYVYSSSTTNHVTARLC